MSKVVIIGASASGHSLAARLREKNKECGITLLTEENYPCYDRRKLYAYFAGKLREKELFLCNADAYARENIELVREVRAINVNCDRRTVYLKNEDSRDSVKYDILVICTGRKTSIPDIPGSHKEGVFTLESLSDVKAAKSAVINGPVCFYGEWNGRCAELARVLLQEKKELLLVSPSAPSAELPAGLPVLTSSIVEMIGESSLQAIKLTEGKIIGTSFVVVTGPALPSTEFLDESGLRRENGFISVDADNRTSRDGVYACGPVTGSADSWDGAVARARALAETLSATLQ